LALLVFVHFRATQPSQDPPGKGLCINYLFTRNIQKFRKFSKNTYIIFERGQPLNKGQSGSIL